MLAAITLASMAGGQQPVPLHFKVPYHCKNDSTVVVDRCEQKAGTEYCFVRAGLHGQLGNEAMVLRAQLAPLASTCTVQIGSVSAQTGSQPAQAAKTFNPPYLSEMPSVERVMSAMQTKDPRETALRQVGAFYELMEIIKTLSGHREFGGYLPDEKRILDEYSIAQYNVGQAADKAFPGPHANDKLSGT
jgi:hypothetical protein